MHSFLVADESNQSTLYAANFGSWYFGFVFARWSSSSRTSLFLMFEVVNDTDDNFNTADNDDGDDAKKCPSTIERTPLKGWKTTETTRPPMNQRPRTQFVFFSEFSTLTYQRLSF